MSSLVLFLVLLTPILVCSSELVIYVDGVNGHSDASCLKPHGHPCQSLEYVQRQVKSVTVVIEIFDPGVNLTAPLIFEDFIDLSIRGSESTSQITIHCNTSNSGLSFLNVTGLSLSSLIITNCGAEGNSTAYDPYTKNCLIITSAVYILNCTDVNISDITLYGSNGTGISMYDTNGKVLIENTNFVESFVRDTNSDVAFGGGGLHIEFTYCTPGTFNTSCTHRKGRNKNAAFAIHHCTFSNNFINITNDSQYFDNRISWFIGQPIGSGGGAYIIFASDATNISMNLFKCMFQGNHAPRYGGGLKIMFLDSVQNNRVSLTETMFSNNMASDGTGMMGGGLQISFKFFKLAFGYLKSARPENNIVNLTSCEFRNNTAHSGGGVNVFSAEIPLQDTQSAVYFCNCTWTGNTALYGAAVHIMPGVWVSLKDSHYPQIVFSNINIFSNKVVPVPYNNQSLKTQTNGAGAFFSTQLNVNICGTTTFASNNGTALYLTNSIAKFQPFSQVVFDSNTGKNGGGVALIGRSSLSVNHSCNFTFVNNNASQLGGGIYFHTTSANTHQPCFIYHGYNVTQSSFFFIGNHASAGRGNHIYVSSFTSCYFEFDCVNIFECIGNFTFHNPPIKNSIASLPSNFKLNSTSPFLIYPGLSTQLPLIVKDLENNTVSNMSYEAVLEKKHSHSIKIDPAFQYVSNNTIIIQGQPWENATLYLDPSSTDISVIIEIKLVGCPPGYVLNTKNQCECGSIGIVKCDPKPRLQYGTWMGLCNHTSTQLCISPCPLGYCVYRGLYQPLPVNAKDLEQNICSPNRTGLSCGSCKPNHSVYYNSWIFECGNEDKCYLGVFFYILSALIPLTIVFLVIVIFDTNIVNGWNGFLLFTQIVIFLPIHANGIIYFPTHLNIVLETVWSVYDFFNLDFFDYRSLSFCLWKGATVMEILMVQLASICFALSLVFITVFVLKQHKLAKCFPCLLRRRYTVVNGLSAFFILCYARCAWICFLILAPACLYDYNFRCLRIIAFYSGSLEYFKGVHIVYAIVAIIFCIFIVILPAFFLLFYPLFFKILGLCNLSESRAAIFLWQMMPIQLMDSFQNPFKNDYRCFAGLYFLYRAVTLALRLFTSHLTQFIFTAELEFIIIIVFHAAFQPYKKRVHNIIDLLLFFNLAFINWITMYNLDTYKSSAAPLTDGVVFWMSVQVLLLCLPLATAIVVIIIKMLIVLKITLKGNKYLSIQPKT